MALTPQLASSTDPLPAEDGGAHIDAPELRLFVMALFFIFGGITSLNDVIIPKLKELFTLNYMQAMLVQSAFFAAYFAISIPGAMVVKRLGYMRGAVVGLLTMMVGCLLFIPASASATFGVFLAALFVLGGRPDWVLINAEHKRAGDDQRGQDFNRVMVVPGRHIELTRPSRSSPKSGSWPRRSRTE